MSTRRHSTLPIGALFAVVVWGASFVVTRVALRSFTPWGLVSARMFGGLLLLVTLQRAYGGAPLLRRDRAACCFLGVVLGVHLLIQAYGLQYTTAINTGWIIGFIPVMIALASHALGTQRLRPRGWAGVTVATAGVLFVTMAVLPDFRNARFGDLLQISSCVTWTVYTLVGAGPVARNGSLSVTVWALGVAFVISLGPAAWFGVTQDAMTVEALAGAAFLGVVCSGLAFVLWYRALHEHGPTSVGAMLYLEPFVTLGIAASVLDEPITSRTVLGGVCVLAGVWLVATGVARRTTTAT